MPRADEIRAQMVEALLEAAREHRKASNRPSTFPVVDWKRIEHQDRSKKAMDHALDLAGQLLALMGDAK